MWLLQIRHTYFNFLVFGWCVKTLIIVHQIGTPDILAVILVDFSRFAVSCAFFFAPVLLSRPLLGGVLDYDCLLLGLFLNCRLENFQFARGFWARFLLSLVATTHLVIHLDFADCLISTCLCRLCRFCHCQPLLRRLVACGFLLSLRILVRRFQPLLDSSHLNPELSGAQLYQLAEKHHSQLLRSSALVLHCSRTPYCQN